MTNRSPNPAVQGEGDIEADRHYREATQAFVQKREPVFKGRRAPAASVSPDTSPSRHPPKGLPP